MQVSVESVSKLERRMTVEVPAERIDDEVESRLRSMKGRAQIKGFRPGKVPLKVVKQHYGKGVYQEVLGEVLQASFQEAVTQEKLEPAGMPNIESVESNPGEQLVYKATFEVYPEVELIDMAEIQVSEPQADITDSDVDQMIEKLRSQRQTWEEVDRVAEKGDQVVIDFEGFIGDEAFEGGKANDMPVVIGEGRMIPGFEDQLEGVVKDEEKNLEVTFPEDYQSDVLAGKEARFEVKVKVVNAPKLPEVNDDFAKAFGVADGSIQKLREDVTENMQREMEQAVKMRVKGQIMEALAKQHELEIPKVLIDGEIRHMREQAMSSTGQTESSGFPDEMFTEDAEKRVTLGLIVGRIIRDNKLVLEQDRVEIALNEIAASYEDSEQVKQYYRSNKEQMSSVEAMVLEEQVVDWIKSKAKVSVEKSSFDQLVNPKKDEA
jgi:trigger factor